ncbi:MULTISPECIES: helix-turn-helix domain-containing protein [unclassified Mesorhizobium]|uniref:helix-turn-helix domain-containing protein n=1 Tax=unclassified Mesorhizobium TaxID=325217 RepID=UPI0030153E04
MPREPGLSPDKIKDIADRAEGIKPEQPEAVVGRPPKYKDTFAAQAAKLCGLGATNADLADFFEVSIRTIERWTSEHEEFCRAVKEAKETANARVERSLYQRAVGYSFDSEKVFNDKGKILRAATREHCPPDTTAQIFWLKNRKPDEWRDKHEVEANGNLTIEIVSFSDGK